MHQVKNQHTTFILVSMGLFFSGFLTFMIWWVEYSWVGSFEERAVTFKGSDNPPDIKAILNDQSKPLVVHFVDPTCECTRFSEDHINHLTILLQKYVQSVTIFTNGNASVPAIDQTLQQKLQDWAPAAPATAIWDSQGNLAYFGPYSSGTICGRGKDLVIYTLNNLLKGINPKWYNQEAVGCYCLNSAVPKSINNIEESNLAET